MENNLFYCYSCKMKDFIKSQGIRFITKAIHPRTNRVFFVFEKSEALNLAIQKWNEVKVKSV